MVALLLLLVVLTGSALILWRQLYGLRKKKSARPVASSVSDSLGNGNCGISPNSPTRSVHSLNPSISLPLPCLPLFLLLTSSTLRCLDLRSNSPSQALVS